MIIYGRNPVREALRGRRAVSAIWATKNAARDAWLTEATPTVHVVGSEEVERLAGSPDHQAVCAEVEAFGYASEQEVLGLEAPLILALDEVQDPRNLGAICRTAECAGAAAVVITRRRSAEITAAACKASAGAVEHLPVVRVVNLAEFLAQAKRAGLWCYGADARGDLAYDSVDYAGGIVLVLGSEGRGLRPRVARSCDALVSLPLCGRVESLSVSAAAAILLYEAVRRRA